MQTTHLTRRQMLKLGSAAAFGPSATTLDASSRCSTNDGRISPKKARQFPKGFLWGTASAAYQIEGAANEDGKGKSIWDTFSHTPGNIKDGSTGDVACDHYHRYKADVQLMKALGASSYRFSISWPRVFPTGKGKPNPKGLDFYSKLVDELLTAGIKPFATLFQWDLPQALQNDGGGWASKDLPKVFADYAGYVAYKLSDRVKHFFTVNDLYSLIEFGYGPGIPVPFGTAAPGAKLPPAQLNQTRHYALVGHGLAVQAIRAKGKIGTKVGLAAQIFVPVPLIETREHIHAAKLAIREANGKYLTAILEGKYWPPFLAEAGKDAPKFTDMEMKTIASPCDFIGINVFTPGSYVRASHDAPGYSIVPFGEAFPTMASPWVRIGPEVLYWAPRLLANVWNVKDIYITACGCPADDVPDMAGRVDDIDRVMFLRNYLTQLQRATDEGVPVRGFFLWSLMDSFEWMEGYSTRFGLHYVDYNTQKRTPKLSAQFYKEVIAWNAVA